MSAMPGAFGWWPQFLDGCDRCLMSEARRVVHPQAIEELYDDGARFTYACLCGYYWACSWGDEDGVTQLGVTPFGWSADLDAWVNAEWHRVRAQRRAS